MPQSIYYYWINHGVGIQEQKKTILKQGILEAWKQIRCVYGYPRIHQVLLNNE